MARKFSAPWRANYYEAMRHMRQLRRIARESRKLRLAIEAAQKGRGRRKAGAKRRARRG